MGLWLRILGLLTPFHQPANLRTSPSFPYSLIFSSNQLHFYTTTNAASIIFSANSREAHSIFMRLHYGIRGYKKI